MHDNSTAQLHRLQQSVINRIFDFRLEIKNPNPIVSINILLLLKIARRLIAIKKNDDAGFIDLLCSAALLFQSHHCHQMGSLHSAIMQIIDPFFYIDHNSCIMSELCSFSQGVLTWDNAIHVEVSLYYCSL